MKKAFNDGQEARRVKLPTTRFNEKHGIAGPELFWLFFFGSLLGVLMEGVYCKFVHGAWETHVVSIWGPFCILYGIGAVAFYVGNVVWEDKKKWQKFLLFGFLGSGLEVICGAILEYGLGMYAWDYSEQFMNFRGYVSLSMTAAWGAIGLLFSFAIPRIDAAYGFMQTHAWHMAYVILAIFLTIDRALPRPLGQPEVRHPRREPHRTVHRRAVRRRLHAEPVHRVAPHRVETVNRATNNKPLPERSDRGLLLFCGRCTAHAFGSAFKICCAMYLWPTSVGCGSQVFELFMTVSVPCMST